MTLPTLLLVAAATLGACWASVGVRRVQQGQWMAVLRGDRVRRVRTSGLVARWPFVERFAHDVDEPHQLPLQVRATTRDGVPVVVLAETTVSFPRPAVGARYADPWPGAEVTAEETIARTVAGWSAAELTQTADATHRPLRHAVRRAVDGLGVDVVDLELVEVAVPLQDDASRGAG